MFQVRDCENPCTDNNRPRLGTSLTSLAPARAPQHAPNYHALLRAARDRGTQCVINKRRERARFIASGLISARCLLQFTYARICKAVCLDFCDARARDSILNLKAGLKHFMTSGRRIRVARHHLSSHINVIIKSNCALTHANERERLSHTHTQRHTGHRWPPTKLAHKDRYLGGHAAVVRRSPSL